MGTPRFVAQVLFLILAGLGMAACREEHPEHPKKQENPGNPEAKATLTTEELAQAIEKYVADTSARQGGVFMVKDQVEGKELALTLKKIHKDKLAQISPGVYFLCADFAGADGTVYDLDIFMKGPDADHLETTEVTIHKKNGVERYSWYEEGGLWKKRPAGQAEEHPKEKEHPEHPK